jgi:hypothetical protein
MSEKPMRKCVAWHSLFHPRHCEEFAAGGRRIDLLFDENRSFGRKTGGLKDDASERTSAERRIWPRLRTR